MLRVDQVGKRYGGRVVLDGVSFIVQPGQRFGLVGPNGSGKSTLLRLIAGELSPETGRVELPPSARIGYLPQAMGTVEINANDGLESLWLSLRGDEAIAEAAARLASAGAGPEAARAYEAVLARVAAVAPGDEVLAHARDLGVDLMLLDAELPSLSGGELAKLALLSVMASRPDVLLLDEPTNHLDFAGLGWLEDWLEEFEGPLLLVSHDRALLDETVDALVALDPATGRAEVWHGDYASWAHEQARRLADQWQAYERQRREERRLRRVISAIESRSRNVEQRTIHFHYRKRAKKVARRATTLKARLERQTNAEERVARPAKAPIGLGGSFGGGSEGAIRLVEVMDASIGFPGVPLLEHLDLTVERGRRVFIVGPNGSGKSTLLRTILGELPALGGRVRLATSARPGVLQQGTPGDALPGRTPLEVMRRAATASEPQAFNLLHRFLFHHDLARQPLERLSEGERRRLQLATLIVGGANLLVLDEPTNHLDIPSREALESALGEFEGAMLAVSHDRYFVDQFADEVYEVREQRLVGQ